MPEWLTLNNAGAVSSAIALVVAFATLCAARGARRAAQEAREAVQAKSLADVMTDLVQWSNLLAHAAQKPDAELFQQIGIELLARLRQVTERYREQLGVHRRQLRDSARRVGTCLEQAAGGEYAHDTFVLSGRMTRTGLDLQSVVASAAGHLENVADDASTGG